LVSENESTAQTNDFQLCLVFGAHEILVTEAPFLLIHHSKVVQAQFLKALSFCANNCNQIRILVALDEKAGLVDDEEVRFSWVPQAFHDLQQILSRHQSSSATATTIFKGLESEFFDVVRLAQALQCKGIVNLMDDHLASQAAVGVKKRADLWTRLTESLDLQMPRSCKAFCDGLLEDKSETKRELTSIVSNDFAQSHLWIHVSKSCVAYIASVAMML